MRTIPHPWRTLSQLDDVVVCWRQSLPGTTHAATDGQHIIWMRDDLKQVERRCALQHELIHLDLGHLSHQYPYVERQVRRLTAEALIPISALLDTRRWALSLEEWAAELWVTVAVLRDRLANLSPAEEELTRRLVDAARDRGAD